MTDYEPSFWRRACRNIRTEVDPLGFALWIAVMFALIIVQLAER